MLPPSSAQEIVINATLNGFLLTVLFLGVYTVVYLGTLYIYCTKKSSRQWIVMTIISLSYLVYVIQTGVDWYITKWALVNNGATRETVFMAIFYIPTWVTFINDICNFLLSVLADGLLIWRCFNVWDRSFRAISIPSLLLFSEIAVDLATVIMTLAVKLNPSASQAHTLNTLLGAATFMTLATTLVTTSLISYRVHSFSRQNLPTSSNTRFNHIVEILVQSATLYCIVALAYAIVVVIPFTANNIAPLNAAQGYASDFYAFTSGVAPTIMVARVAFADDLSENVPETTHMSGLRFYGHATMPTATQSRRDLTIIGNGDPDLQHESDNLDEKRGGTLPSV